MSADYESGQANAWDCGYTGARTDTTQQSRQTPDKEAVIKHITVYVSSYTETEPTGMLSPNNCRLSGQQRGFVSPTDTCCNLHRIRVSLQWTKRI